MAEIKNTFLKGKMNQDLDSRILPNGEYREAINLCLSRSEGSTVGEFENILGNKLISQTENSAIIIGFYIDESKNRVFIFATDHNNASGTYDKSSKNYIYELSLSGNYARKTLVKGAFLNFNQSFPIIGVNLVEDLLFFTDNLNQPRKINVTLANPENVASPTHYSKEDQISVAKYAPCEPIITIDRIVRTVTTAGTNISVLTINSSADINPGDAVFPLETITVPSGWDNRVYVVAVNPGGVANKITLSKQVTVSANQKLSITRSTATNKTNEYNPNGVKVQGISIPSGTGVDTVYQFALPALNKEASVIPKLGDLVLMTNVAGTTSYLPNNTSIVSATATAFSGNGEFLTWQVKLSNAPINLPSPWPGSAVMALSANPDYDPLWSQQDSNSKFLEDKFVRFSYRFKFEDNEHSLMAPFTQPIFIPKQFSSFGGGNNSSTEDMDNAYKSTIIAWFENNVQNILLKIPLPYSTLQQNIDNLLIKDIDILYKESDALAVKVLNTVDIADLPNKSATLGYIDWHDPVHGDNNTYYYPYNYASSKPYKTLPNDDITRVYDKVPVKALSQEVIGNRVVYGNYIDKHSSPSNIPYAAIIKDRDAYSVNTVEYPAHTLKQNRTYQVGFILVDRYGRQSNVILSSHDYNENEEGGSTVYAPYKTYAQQENNSKVIDWLGDALSVRVDSAIGTENTGGQPGVYNGDPTSSNYNPLGWYSYKVVVKQQEQEYYNVYLPGFVNGYPIVNSSEKDKTSFSVLLSDNINKVPRDLNEVGPNDREYSSSETLFIRVNNPAINTNGSAGARPYGYPQKFTPWNKQYYPDLLSQEVTNISTVRDLEISAIPFVANAPEGEYGSIDTNSEYVYGGSNPNVVTEVIEVTEPTGSIPWGQAPKLQPLYDSDSNPFIMQISTVQNGKTPKPQPRPTYPGPIGAYTTNKDRSTASGSGLIVSMQPFLSIAETKPFESVLELFYETSLQGKVAVLNEIINSQYAGIIGIDGNNFASFSESIAPGSQIGSSNIIWKDGAGNNITNNSLFTSPPAILSVYRASDVGQSNNVANKFQLVHSGGSNAEYKLKTASGAYFWYSESSASNPSNDVYNFTFQTVYEPTSGEEYTDNTTYTAALTNVQPTFTAPSSCPLQLTGITLGTSTIYSFTGKNGSNLSGGNSDSQLIFELDSSNSQAILDGFRISSSGVLTANSGTLVNENTYSIKVKVTDANGFGLSNTCVVNFNVGTDPVPQTICAGRIGGTNAECNENIEYQFLASGVQQVSGTYAGTPFNTAYPPNKIYNAKFRSTFTPKTTGALTQGKMYIKPHLQRETTLSDDIYVDYLVQYRATSSSSWGTAQLANGNTFGSPIGYKRISIDNTGPSFVEDSWQFDTPGEYRVIASKMAGDNCGSGSNSGLFHVKFGDAVYGTGAGSSCSS